jgi:hypothetical protein
MIMVGSTATNNFQLSVKVGAMRPTIRTNP